jgi:hypothetical protein
MLSVALLTFTLETRRDQPEIYRTADTAIVISTVLALGVGLTGWGAKTTLGTLVVLILFPVAMGTVVWLKHTAEPF